jgi:hypothetical protein
VVQSLVEHPQLREFLEDDLYEVSGSLLIRIIPSDEEAVILKDEKLVIPHEYDNEAYIKAHEQQIVAVFETLDCSDISVGSDADGKHRYLHVGFDTVKVDHLFRDEYFTHWLTYTTDLVDSRDPFLEGAESVLPNWYYRRMWYT